MNIVGIIGGIVHYSRMICLLKFSEDYTPCAQRNQTSSNQANSQAPLTATGNQASAYGAITIFGKATALSGQSLSPVPFCLFRPEDVRDHTLSMSCSQWLLEGVGIEGAVEPNEKKPNDYDRLDSRSCGPAVV